MIFLGLANQPCCDAFLLADMPLCPESIQAKLDRKLEPCEIKQRPGTNGGMTQAKELGLFDATTIISCTV